MTNPAAISWNARRGTNGRPNARTDNTPIPKKKMEASDMSELQDYALRIDGPLLRRHRQWLMELTERTTHDDQDHLERIVSLLDGIADQAHDRHGIASLLEPEAEKP